MTNVGSVFAESPTPVASEASQSTESIFDAPLAVPVQVYVRGTVSSVLSEEQTKLENQTFYIQKLQVRLEDGTEVEVDVGSEFQPLNENQRLRVGNQVVIAKETIDGNTTRYVLADVFRIPIMVYLLVGFFILVVLIAGSKGAFSIVGMFLSLAILMGFVIPHILQGENPLLVALAGLAVTAIITMYLSHGFKWETHVALSSMLLTLLLVGVVSYGAVILGKMVGLGSEEAYYLQFGPASHINLRGLLLAGMLLGALGILDDIALSQVSVTSQLHSAKPNISFQELYWRALSVGQDHVASLVNTLVLAYAGSSLPLFLLFSMNQSQPAWVTLNSEIIAEEVIRTLSGSIGLVIAVPLTTVMAAYIVTKYKKLPKAKVADSHGHAH